MRIAGLLVGLVLLVATAQAAVLHLKNGGTLRGTVLQETDELVTFGLQYATVTLRRAEIASIERTVAEQPEAREAHGDTPKDGARLPRWSIAVGRLAKAPWATGLSQIPATVIDKGVMRNVPYASYRCGTGGDCEVNIYGDPDMPAGLEIGLSGALVSDSAAKKRCIEFLASVLPDASDAAILKAARSDEDKIVRGGLTVEITPATAPDAYGAWWASVYYVERLDQARAGEKELETITVAREELPKAAAGTPPVAQKTPEAAPKGPPKPAAAPPAPAAVSNEPPLDWTPADLQKARRTPAASATPSSSGRVYVRGYYRKDGTYVRPHTRRR